MLLLFEVLVSDEEEEVEVLVVCPSSLSSILRFSTAFPNPCAADMVHHYFASDSSFVTPCPVAYMSPKLNCAETCPKCAA